MQPTLLRIVWVSLLLCPMLGMAQSNLQLVQDYLGKRAKSYGLTPEDVQALQVTDEYTSSHNGVVHVYAEQTFQGIPVNGANISAHILDGQVISLHQTLVPNIRTKASMTPRSVDQIEAIRKASSSMGITEVAPVPAQSVSGNLEEMVCLAREISRNDIHVKLEFHKVSNQEVILCWNFQILKLDGSDWFDFWVGVEQGQIVERVNWVNHCQFDHPSGPHTHRHDGSVGFAAPQGIMAGNYRAFPIGVESPIHGNRTLLVDPDDMVASPFGWHDTDGQPGAEYTITRGNNVYAYEDWDNNNAPGYSPDGGAGLIFDFPYDISNSTDSNRNGALTNLFVWNNFMHDVLYHYGFDEAAGNFQETNYTGSGAGSDPVNAEGFDGSGFNNANFATPPDGSNPRMQMYLWNASAGGDALTINTPAGIAGTYSVSGASFGPGLPTTPITADIVEVLDINGSPTVCDVVANPTSVAGKIALIDRGGCLFVDKVLNAQNAGAVAVIIINNQAGGTFTMGGSSNQITIPSIMVSQSDGLTFRQNVGLGLNGTIQDGGLPNGLDSNVDNGIVAHEYGHGISNRLTGGPAAAGCLTNEEQAGEGWSDFFSLIMTHEPGDQGSTSRGIGNFANGGGVNSGGIRPYPYSTNMSINPVTYDDIKVLSVPHGVGSVFCSMIWDLYWALTDEYGYDPDIYYGTGGNNTAIQLVMDGMKLQPCSPGFVDMRDAIILADQINNGGANECLIWEVFARRGLGYSAVQGSTDDRGDGVEAFDLPPVCQEVLLMSKTVEPLQAQVGDTVTYFISFDNNQPTDVNNVVVFDTLSPGLTFVPGSGDCNAIAIGQVVTMSIGTVTAGTESLCSFQAVVTDSLGYSTISFSDGFEDLTVAYTQFGLIGTDGWSIDTANAYEGDNAFFVPNVGADNDQFLELPPVLVDSNVVLSFHHSYATEAGWDGGVVEIRDAFQANWIDLKTYFIQNGYNDSLGINNPSIGGRPAFSGNSQGYIETKADLSDFAGVFLYIRFRFMSDDNTSDQGWWVDNIRMGDEVTIFNTAYATSSTVKDLVATTPEGTLVLQGDTTVTTTIDTELDLGISIYPIPAHDRLVLEMTEVSDETLSLKLYNLMGQTLKARELPVGQSIHELSVEDLPAGVYLLELTSESGAYNQKVIIE
ncbi:T9SS-dependent M36 family metallopeptidase [Pontibacter sp. G13]|uniref:T9SS-dependent M36 family metallopeptidase n=1 Tax=Pontibacter sp. G13 TaxID=3074898 RepID=UPI00288B1927|nr:T9SS-dependent M36 family metallopeptidase [Pontibacter sp. G13]WNJ19184.1 T9SS-dependent M36 family metallopeptidase [Pontibacter sp. G13]